MLEPLRMIPEPLFLVLLIGLTGLGIYLFIARSLEPTHADPAVERRLSPYELAYLAHGPRGVIETALATADANGLVQLDSKTGRILPLSSVPTDDPVLAELLKDLSKTEGSPRGLSLAEAITNTLAEVTRLELWKPSSYARSHRRAGAFFGGLALIAFLRLLDDHPSLGIASMWLLLSSLAIWKILPQVSSAAPSAAGHNCVQARRRSLEPLLLNDPSTPCDADERIFLISIFGFQELTRTRWAERIPLAGLVVASNPNWMKTPKSYFYALSEGEEAWTPSHID